MHVQRVDAPRPRPAGGQSGFALILALLALMLLTFLGLTLAATSSTELQIATNYRWSQQALYNAEAGLEVAKWVLTQEGGTFTAILPGVRPGPWNFGQTGAAGGPPDPRTLTPARAGMRDYDRMGCADRAGVGYGRILTLPDGTPAQDVSQFMGASVNGAFTIWVRRNLLVNTDGTFSDSTNDQAVVVTAEGIAPYLTQTSAFARANQARRVLEVSYALLLGSGTRCQGLAGQEGLAASGENFDPCSPLKASGVAGAFGAASLTDTGKQ